MSKDQNLSVLTFEIFVKYIQRVLIDNDLDYIDLNAGEIHRTLGGYPGKNHRMPICCKAMRSLMASDDMILYQPSKGNGASLTVRYFKRNKADK